MLFRSEYPSLEGQLGAIKDYGILKGYDVKSENYQWAQRANIVIDKEGIIQHVEFDESAINPNNALDVCTNLRKKQTAK